MVVDKRLDSGRGQYTSPFCEPHHVAVELLVRRGSGTDSRNDDHPQAARETELVEPIDFAQAPSNLIAGHRRSNAPAGDDPDPYLLARQRREHAQHKVFSGKRFAFNLYLPELRGAREVGRARKPVTCSACAGHGPGLGLCVPGVGNLGAARQEAFAPALPATGKDGPPSLCFHAGTKTVLTLAGALGRLVSTFHGRGFRV